MAQERLLGGRHLGWPMDSSSKSHQWSKNLQVGGFNPDKQPMMNPQYRGQATECGLAVKKYKLQHAGSTDVSGVVSKKVSELLEIIDKIDKSKRGLQGEALGCVACLQRKAVFFFQCLGEVDMLWCNSNNLPIWGLALVLEG